MQLTITTEDPFEIKCLQFAQQMARVLDELAKQTREWRKYDQRADIPADEVENRFYQILAQQGIDVEYLWR